ncbi:MAG TPA: 50S ribosomal protein L24 [Clostridia bacterium]|nr:50S ribosomal protein L24 [Clostridia bacterium]
MSKSVHVKTGDTVEVINGKYRGKRGKVMQVSPVEGKIIVEGVNIVTKHVKPKKMGEPGGMIKAESALYADKVQLVCPKCNKPTRAGSKINAKGKKVRTCKKSDCLAEFE